MCAAPAAAEQQVTLKSGASLVGDVTIEGDQVVLQMNDKQLRVDLADVAVVSTVDFGREEQARRLLLAALETRTLGDERSDVLGMLTEAARLAPDDVHIAFWHANALADGGHGKAAKAIFDQRQPEFEKAYPGRSEKLLARIEQRLELEKLPAMLVDVIDRLNKAAANQAVDAETRPMYAVFRVVDQHKAPLRQADFNLQVNGNNQRVEPFDDGYFLLIYDVHRHNSVEPVRLFVTQAGLKPAEFQIAAAANHVPIVDDFEAHRFGEDEKRKVRAVVVDPKGEPIAGAAAFLQQSNPYGGGNGEELRDTSSVEGEVEFAAYPMQYYLRVNADGYKSDGVQIDLSADGDAESRVQLYPAAVAMVSVEWIRSPMQQGGGGVAGERVNGSTTLQLTGDSAAPQQFRYLFPMQAAGWPE
jgi:hypothetical protein